MSVILWQLFDGFDGIYHHTAAGPHAEMGSSCQYRVTGVNSDAQMDVFRILRLAVLKSTSAGATAPMEVSGYLPLNYEIFAGETPVRLQQARRGSREPGEKMRDTFSRVTTYLRNSGNIKTAPAAARLH